MPGARYSKFNVPPHLFKPEPPSDPRQVKRLFCGRPTELHVGVERLKAGLDLRGRRANGDKYPWVIHGESRSGKSHLARRIFADFPESEQRWQVRVIAGGQLDAIRVLQQLFEKFSAFFDARLMDQKLPVDPLQTVEIRIAKQLVDRIGLFESGTQSVTLTAEDSQRRTREMAGEIGNATLLAKFIAKFQTERSQKDSVQLAVRPPTPADLADVCGIMAETLLRHGLIKHVLVLLDDIDLLETYQSPQQNARVQRSLLADAIHNLHSAPGVDVVLTARSWYVHSDDKRLHTLVDLSRFNPMNVDDLLSVHDERLKISKNPAAAFLTREALRQLAADVVGLPGVFLQHLQGAFYQFQNEDDSAPRDYEWFLNSVRSHLDTLKDKCRDGFQAIQQAISRGSLTIDVRERNPFFGTSLQNEYVYQSYYSETTLFITGLLVKVMPVAAES